MATSSQPLRGFVPRAPGLFKSQDGRRGGKPQAGSLVLRKSDCVGGAGNPGVPAIRSACGLIGKAREGRRIFCGRCAASQTRNLRVDQAHGGIHPDFWLIPRTSGGTRLEC